jgi:tellurite resistance protein TerC
VDSIVLFPFTEYWWLYGVFTGLVLAVLALDLGVFHRQAHVVSFREAAAWSVVWVALGLAVGAVLWWYAGSALAEPERAAALALLGETPAAAADRIGMEYLAGYIIEKALAVDNVFVWAMLFSYFAVPAQYQHRILFYGILGAIVFRALFIALGAVLLQYHWVVWLAGGFLILTGVKMAVVGEHKLEPERNPVTRLLRRLLPITPALDGQRFLVRREGVLMATPLLLVLVLVEVTDIVFAIDSVPAIFAITNEPLLVFTSNICAILGLRAMYFLLASVMDRFHLLKYGLSLILVFVGLKMLGDIVPGFNQLLDEKGKFPIGWSLGIIGAILAISVAASFIFPKRPPAGTGG